jgi:hypothetical protein
MTIRLRYPALKLRALCCCGGGARAARRLACAAELSTVRAPNLLGRPDRGCASTGVFAGRSTDPAIANNASGL